LSLSWYSRQQHDMLHGRCLFGSNGAFRKVNVRAKRLQDKSRKR
jgi:hypothetical protein